MRLDETHRAAIEKIKARYGVARESDAISLAVRLVAEAKRGEARDIQHETRAAVVNEQAARKTYKEKLCPTPAQERVLDDVLWRCRTLYNTALEQRITAWHRRRISVSRFAQEAELQAIRAEFSEYAALHSHRLQDVLARLDKTYQAVFRRLARGEGGTRAGFPRFNGRYGNRYRSFTVKEYSKGATLDKGYLVLSKIGRIVVHWSRPLVGTPKTVTVSKRQTAGMWQFAVPRSRYTHCPRPGKRRG